MPKTTTTLLRAVALVVAILGGACAPEARQDRQALGLECLVDANCDDGNPCTVDKCVLLSAGVATCTNTDVGDPLCCANGTDCSVPNGCQTAQCIPTTHTWKDCVAVGTGGAGCCAVPDDCAPRQCHTVTCTQNLCVYTATPAASGCCSSVDTCPSGNSCQDKKCLDATCVLVGKAGPGCCLSDDDCPPPACQVSECSDNRCHYVDACDAPLALLDARPPPDAGAGGPDAPVAHDAPPGSTDAPLGTDLDAPLGAGDAGSTDAPGSARDAPVTVPDGAETGTHLHGGGGCAVTGAPSTEGWTFLLVALVALASRRRRWGAPFVVLVVVLAIPPARADDAFDAQTFRPSATAHDVVGLDAPDVLPSLALAAAVHLGLTHAPLVVGAGAAESQAVSSRLDAQIAGSVGLGGRLEVGFLLPVLLSQDTRAVGDRSSLDVHALGDLHLEAKLALVRDAPVRLALAGTLGIPLGGDDAFYSDGGVSFRPRLVAGAGSGRLDAVAVAGAILRATRTVLDVEVGPAVNLAAAVRLRLALPLAIVAAIDAEVPTGGGTAAVELLGGPEVRLGAIEVAAAGGRGLTDAVGTPDWRALLTVRGATGGPSTEAPILAVASPPEETPAPPPPPPMASGSTAPPDVTRRAPTAPPTLASVRPDRDGDGIVDEEDRCPDAPETYNGIDDDDGCPETTPALATLKADAIILRQQVYFESGEAEIKAVSHRLLLSVAHILAHHPELVRIRVEGYTDDRGDRMQNEAISQARAEAVRRWLVTDGAIAAERVEAQGFGPDRPLASNRTAAGRAKNRRCEIVVVERAP